MKQTQEPESKSDDAKEKEDWRGEKAVGAGMGKDFQVAQHQEQSPQQAHSEPLYTHRKGIQEPG